MNWHRTVADYFHRLGAQPKEWKYRKDLLPFLRELEHRILARDVSRIVEILDADSTSSLIWTGWAREVNDLLEKSRNLELSAEDEVIVTIRQAECTILRGSLSTAIATLQSVLASSNRPHIQWWRAPILLAEALRKAG
jgi:hypothetical protein